MTPRVAAKNQGISKEIAHLLQSPRRDDRVQRRLESFLLQFVKLKIANIGRRQFPHLNPLVTDSDLGARDDYGPKDAAQPYKECVSWIFESRVNSRLLSELEKAVEGLEPELVLKTAAAWLTAAVTKGCLDFMRKRFRHNEPLAKSRASVSELELREPKAEDWETPADGPPDEHYWLNRCIELLTPQEYLVINRQYWEEDTYSQIARSLEKRTGAVKVSAKRIREKLKACLESRISGSFRGEKAREAHS
jgi:RNA polymerase sigma factor (sigma-70 family)